MTAFFLPLAAVQAALLFWASVRLSDIFLERDKLARLAWFVGTIALPVAIAWWGRTNDPNRVLCGWGDCVALALSVGFVRFWAVNREEDQLFVEHQIARQVAIEKNDAARKAREAEQIRAVAGKLEAKTATKAAAPTRAPLSPAVSGGTGGVRPPGASLGAAK